MIHLPLNELERRIEDTRRSLAGTLRDLEFRLSPRRQARVAWRMAKEGTAPAALVVVGIAAIVCLAVYRSRRSSRSR